MSPKRRARIERAVKRHEKTIASHESGQDLTRRIVEEHIESYSQKFMKFNSNPTEDQIEKLRLKKLERAKSVLENTKNNLRGT
tara:strand:- start:498 stop:746 length:249 start_codon:yes stop_codon:yes gene_type:complete